MDLLIKGVPDEAVAEVKRMAAVAIERHHQKSVVATQAVQDAFEQSVDDFREANGLEKKFTVQEVEP